MQLTNINENVYWKLTLLCCLLLYICCVKLCNPVNKLLKEWNLDRVT